MNLKEAKVGDKIVVSGAWGQRDEIHTVERVTKTQAICQRASFMLTTGKKVGSNGKWDTKYGYIPSDEQLANIKLKQRVRAAHEAISVIKITDDNLEAAEAFIAASQTKIEANNNQTGE